MFERGNVFVSPTIVFTTLTSSSSGTVVPTPTPTPCVNDCNGDCGGSAYTNECGVCVGGATLLNATEGLDACNVCFGNGSSCAGCDAVPNSGAQVDRCGVCLGDNTACTLLLQLSPASARNLPNTTVAVSGAGFVAPGTGAPRQVVCVVGSVATGVQHVSATVVSATNATCNLAAFSALGTVPFTLLVDGSIAVGNLTYTVLSIVTCPALSANNATWPVTIDNTVATATCDAGFGGTPRRTCITGGTWNATIVGNCTRTLPNAQLKRGGGARGACDRRGDVSFRPAALRRA